MMIKITKKILKYTLVAILTSVVLFSCDLMHDSRKDCPEGLFINFVYDYNIHRADLFKDHVGEVTAYIFDKEGYFVMSKTENNKDAIRPLAEWGYTMQITELTPGDYQIVALCHQRSSDEIAQIDGAKYRRTNIQPGDSLSKLFVAIDRGEWTTSNYDGDVEQVSGYKMNHQSMPLDTLWHGMLLEPVKLEYQQPAYATVSLTRNTKSLHVSLRHVSDEEAAQCDVSNYDFYIIDNNDSLSYNNTVISNEKIMYTPYIKWNTADATLVRNGDDAPKTAHAELTFNRLMSRNVNDNPATLHIYNNQTNVLIAKVNLADLLQQGRGAFNYYNYSAQEYLDREYNYNTSFYLTGDKWEYINLTVSILPWVKRIQNTGI